MRLTIVLLILVIEAWAIASVFGSRDPAGRKATWALAIVLFPVVGVLGWREPSPPLRVEP